MLSTDGVEQAELEGPLKALTAAGITVEIISLRTGSIQAVNHLEKGNTFPVDVTLGQAREQDYDALLLPGGLSNPDTLRSTPEAVDFALAFAEAGKPIAAICHGPWILIEADLVRGRRMTSWPAIQSDLKNAGAEWVDEEVVQDGLFITSRKPDDVPAFSEKIIEVLKERAARPETANV